MGTTHALSPPAMDNSQQQSELWSPSSHQVQAEIREQTQMSCTPFQSENPFKYKHAGHRLLVCRDYMSKYIPNELKEKLQHVTCVLKFSICICPIKLWLHAHYGFAWAPLSPSHPAWACQTFRSSGSAPSVGLSLSLCADSHAWTRSCCTMPKRYEGNISCQDFGIKRTDKHFIHHGVFFYLCCFIIL